MYTVGRKYRKFDCEHVLFFVVREYACSKFLSMGKDGSEIVEIGDIGETKEVREVFENNATEPTKPNY